ncbi:hypothetical protein EYB26_002778 [Talaromyces marneffei]|uniref:uncharacterized protein n=1 Tax=Talaromyces marneffei TaxID=37727 RepID=UPI0012AA8D46|nr:uncharacterized protein EYB26_002778 [Talaromyces marneffei]QGA15122.1 hypothetical protein EYB26_002778 [Talaromyces marneffei]
MTLVQETPVTADIINGHTIDPNGIKTAFTSVSPLSDAKVESNRTTNSKPKFELEEHPIDQVRDIKVGIIGAGLSGVTAATLLRAKLPGINVTLYDKNGDVGGTWYENTYPGVRCDIPAHVYQSSFEPNTQWTEEFAQGHEIRNYWQGVARKHGVYERLKTKQKIVKVEWINEETKWKLTIQDLNSDKVYEERLDFVIFAIGHFNAWKLPDYEGIESFKGPLFHSSNWDHNVDLKEKRIALIGNGASGLQVLPSIQPLGSHIDHYARNRTWVVDSFNETSIRRLEPNLFSEVDKESFKDPQKYLEYRKKVEADYFRRFGVIFKNNPQNAELRDKWTGIMLQRVDPALADKIIPDFPPNCRRPTPGPGYLEALSKPNVSYIQDWIQKFTEKGIVTVDGTEREVDIVICSTGAHVNMAPPFPIVANGVNLQEAWKPDGLYGYPFTYLGIAAPGAPNIAWVLGPASAGFSGSIPNSVENQVTYIAKVIRKLRSQGIATITPSFDATNEYQEYAEKFYKRTVWTGNDDSSEGNKNCSSWYNGGIPGGRVVGLFPSSAAAVNYILRDPRWEDYEYTYTSKSGNRFAWFGNGWTTRESANDSSVNLTPHLKDQATIDLRTHFEGWWDV